MLLNVTPFSLVLGGLHSSSISQELLPRKAVQANLCASSLSAV